MPSSKYIIRLLSIAEQDLEDLLSYVAAENARAATESLDQIEARLVALQLHPFAGRIPQSPKLTALGYRVLGIDNYLARIIHEHFCCNRGFAATPSLRRAGSPFAPSTYCWGLAPFFLAPVPV